MQVKIWNFYLEGLKNFVGKEKISQGTNIFSFSHSVLNGLLSQCRLKPWLCGKVLKVTEASQKWIFINTV